MSRRQTRKAEPQEQFFQEESDRDSSRSRSRQKGRRRDYKGGRPAKLKHGKTKQEQQEEVEFSAEEEQNLNIPGYKENKPEGQVIDAFIVFFYEVGEEKGMVLTDRQRTEIMGKTAKNPKLAAIKWTPRHEWHPAQEKQKILEAGKAANLDLTDPKYASLYALLMGVSPIFAQEFTSEIYKFILQIYDIYTDSLANKDEAIQNKLSELASRVCQNKDDEFYLLSFVFKQLKIRSSKSKRETQPITIGRQAAYQKLVKNIYEVMISMNIPV